MKTKLFGILIQGCLLLAGGFMFGYLHGKHVADKWYARGLYFTGSHFEYVVAAIPPRWEIGNHLNDPGPHFMMPEGTWTCPQSGTILSINDEVVEKGELQILAAPPRCIFPGAALTLGNP